LIKALQQTSRLLNHLTCRSKVHSGLRGVVHIVGVGLYRLLARGAKGHPFDEKRGPPTPFCSKLLVSTNRVDLLCQMSDYLVAEFNIASQIVYIL
jgi:hypothetical protein